MRKGPNNKTLKKGKIPCINHNSKVGREIASFPLRVQSIIFYIYLSKNNYFLKRNCCRKRKLKVLERIMVYRYLWFLLFWFLWFIVMVFMVLVFMFIVIYGFYGLVTYGLCCWLLWFFLFTVIYDIDFTQ